MTLLILGLVVFLGMHSLRMLAPGVRGRFVTAHGVRSWKSLHGLVSLIGLALLVWGFTRAGGHTLYVPPGWLRHLNSLFTLVAFVLAAAAYVPRNHLKAALGHPLLASVKVWALGHLLATGGLRDVVLFGAFLIWAVAEFAVSRRRDRANHVNHPPGRAAGDVLTVVVALAIWVLFAFWLHAQLFGVDPLA